MAGGEGVLFSEGGGECLFSIKHFQSVDILSFCGCGKGGGGGGERSGGLFSSMVNTDSSVWELSTIILAPSVLSQCVCGGGG